MKKILLACIILSLISCKSKKDLELIIENKEVVLFNIAQPNDVTTGEYSKKNGVIINYKLINNSNEAYVLLLCPEDFGAQPDYFKYNFEINLNILTEKDSIKSQEFLSPEVHGSDYGCKESFRKKYYKNIGYGLNDSIFPRFSLVNDNLMVIHPGEVFNFKTFTTLPYVIKDNGLKYGYRLDAGKKYYMRLNFSNSKEGIEQYLTDEKKKDIKDNKYKIYDGIIYSNKVSVSFQ